MSQVEVPFETAVAVVEVGSPTEAEELLDREFHASPQPAFETQDVDSDVHTLAEPLAAIEFVSGKLNTAPEVVVPITVPSARIYSVDAFRGHDVVGAPRTTSLETTEPMRAL